MSALTAVNTEDAPAAIGPYVQAIKVDGFVFASGSIPLDPKTMKLVPGGIEEQTTQALANMSAIVKASGSSLDKVVKATVFLADMNDFAAMNKIYSATFGTHKPARSAVQVARLPLDSLVEIEVIAKL